MVSYTSKKSKKSKSSRNSRNSRKKLQNVSSKKSGKCVALNEVKEEINNLIKIANDSGNSDIAEIFFNQLNALSKQKSKSSVHMTGGASKLCHILTTAMFLSSGSAISYLTYMQVMPIITKAMPKLCNGAWDQFLGASLGKISSDFSCEARQAAWDKLRLAIISAAGGGPSILLSFKDIRHNIKNIYFKVLEWNEKNLCPLLSSSGDFSKKAVCYSIKAPFKAIASIAHSTKKALSRKSAMFDILHGQDSPVSSPSSSSSSSSSLKRRSRSRTPVISNPKSKTKDIRDFFDKPKSKTKSSVGTSSQ